MKRTLLGLAMAAAAVSSAYAGDLYLGLGLPYYTVGYAHTINDAFGVRGEYSLMPTIKRDTTEDGINYQGRFKYQTIGAFGDWHPMNGAFRVVGGLTVNDTKLSLNATSATGTVTVGGRTVNLAGETFNVNLIYPRVTPYVGLGWGFSSANTPGFNFYADLGVLVGRFKTEVTTTLVGRQGVTQADIDAETADLRDATAKLSVLPKFSIGVSYRF